MRRQRTPWIVCLAAFVWLAWAAQAVAAPDRRDEVLALWYRSLGVEQGLSRSYVTAMAADRDGFMWFGTLDGLNRWDGYRFEVFRAEPGSAGGIGSNVILALHAAADGAMWVGTPDALYRYDAGTNTFRRFVPKGGRVQNVNLLASDAQGRAWVGGFGAAKLSVVDPRDGSWQTQRVDGTSNVRVSAMRIDSSNRLWLALMPQLAFGSKSDTVCRLVAYDLGARGSAQALPRPIFETSGGRVDTIAEDPAGRIWFAGVGGGLIRYDPKTRHADRIVGNAADDTSLVGLHVHNLVLDPSGALWSLTEPLASVESVEQRQIYRIDPETLEVRHVMLHERETGSSGDARLNDLATDPSGVLWLSTDGGGLRYADVSARGFELYRRETSGGQGLNASFVRAVLRDRSGTVWVGTPRGLNRLDRRTGTNTAGVIPLPHPYVECLYEDRLGRLWVGTVGGLAVKEPSGAVRVYRHDGSDPTSLGDNFVQTIHESSDGRIWIGTLGGGLDALAPGTRTFVHHGAVPTDAGGLPSKRVFALHESAGSLWIGTDAGLARLSLASDASTAIERIAAAPSALGPEPVLTISESPAYPGVLWIGTERRGLCRLDIATSAAACLDSRNSALPDRTVYGILPDGNGRLWLSTNRGLTVYDPGAGSFRTYDTDTRLQSKEFNERASFLAPDGEMFVGGVAGLNAFYPDSLAGNPYAPRVFVTAVYTSGHERGRPGAETAPIYRHGMPQQDVTLSFAQREVTFDYVALHFSDPASLRYAYHLDGYDTVWQESVTARSVRYTNLPPGRYRFRVRAVTSAGIQSREDASFGFEVLPPFYATTGFRGTALGLLVLGLTIGYQYRMRNVRRQREHLERQVASRTYELQHAAEALARQAEQLKELDAAKSRFFANISHEFRTPLALTLGPLRDVRSGMHGAMSVDALHEIDQAIRHTERQLQLVEQLLELARLDAGRLAFHPEPADLVAIARIAAAHYESHSRRQQVAFHLSCPAEPVRGMADEERLERAVSNLLDNAFKFTPAGGTVALTMIHEGEWATMAVEDTGPGIPPADLPRLFERFYRGARDAEQIPGTGIGLALAREYVEMHGGTIAAENRPGGGARFIIRLPADAAASARTMPAPPTAGPQPTGTTPDDERAEESVVNERANTGPATVLVIEDHPDMRAYVRKHLAPHYRVIEAARGDEGLEAVRAELPDVIVCDVMMPGLDGFALCRAIKADPETDFLPIVMLTAKAGPEGRLAGLEQGADDYLTKPFVPAELLARIRNLLTSRERLKAHLIDRQPVPVRLAAPRVMPSADETLLNRLRDVLDSAAHDEEFDVPALAAGVGMSRAQLHRRLRSAFQTTPAEMIVEYRLQRAVQMLEGRAGNVSEVAYAVGFKNVSHFVRRFRERHGQTPASWASSRVDHRQ